MFRAYTFHTDAWVTSSLYSRVATLLSSLKYIHLLSQTIYNFWDTGFSLTALTNEYEVIHERNQAAVYSYLAIQRFQEFRRVPRGHTHAQIETAINFYARFRANDDNAKCARVTF